MRLSAMLIAFVLFTAPVTSFAQGAPMPEENTGPKVGAKAPEFTLKDQNGADRVLADFLKEGKVALVFYRSADW
ncbi:MAG: hypothetical protein AAB353_10625 [Candidatus Hydrogenedentota bacterium]